MIPLQLDLQIPESVYRFKLPTRKFAYKSNGWMDCKMISHHIWMHSCPNNKSLISGTIWFIIGNHESQIRLGTGTCYCKALITCNLTLNNKILYIPRYWLRYLWGLGRWMKKLYILIHLWNGENFSASFFIYLSYLFQFYVILFC